MRSFVIFTDYQMSFGCSSQGKLYVQGMCHVEQKKNVNRVLVGKHEGKKQLARQGYKLEDN
jgi:hypothetical protein